MASEEAHKTKREDALISLYEECYGQVSRYIFVRIGNQHEAEDLASEVFLRALKSLDSYQERGLPMKAWIFRIARNLVVDYLRKMSQKHMVPLDDVILHGSIDPEEMAEQNLQTDRLSEALEHLSPAQREVIGLRFFAGLSSIESGEVLGKKPGAIREMQSAAIKSLRTILDG